MIVVPTAWWAHYPFDLAAWVTAAFVARWQYRRWPEEFHALARDTKPSYHVSLAVGALLDAILLGCGILIAGLSGLCSLLIFVTAMLGETSKEELAYLPAAVIFALAPFVMGVGAFLAGRHLLRTPAAGTRWKARLHQSFRRRSFSPESCRQTSTGLIAVRIGPLRRQEKCDHFGPALKVRRKSPLTTSMTEHYDTQERGQRGLLAWLSNRFAGESAESEAAAPATEPEADKGIHDPRELRRRQLLDDVSRFLMTHRLEVNSYTLGVAHDVITGSDAKLSRLIEGRVSSRQPITLEWLQQAAGSSGRNDGSEMLRALMQRLEDSLEEFARTTRDASSATRDYQTALEGHVGELEQVGKAGLVISDLAAIARVMLDRTREIEDQMSRSEKRTLALQKNLEEARRSAETDHLTGLPNRRAFEGVLQSTVEEAKAAGEDLCVAFCDIDHFKRVNDTHGHEAGDRVLKAVAQTLARISNDHCHVARHGGEEFVVLFRGKSLSEAHAILDKARESMAERKLVNRATDMPFGRITFSGGLANVFAHSEPSEALRAADEALYAAKNGGRNRIIVSGEGPPLESVA